MLDDAHDIQPAIALAVQPLQHLLAQRGGADRDGPPLTRAARVGEGFDADYAQGQIVVSREFGDIRFKSSTGITGQQLEERYDATPPDGDPRLFVQKNETDMIANETRIWQPLGERFGWLFGASFTSNDTKLTRTLGNPEMFASTTGVRNAVDEFTDVELGVAEEGALVGSDEGAGDGEEFLVGGLADRLGELSGLGFLFGGKGGASHESTSVARGISIQRSNAGLCVQRFRQLSSCPPRLHPSRLFLLPPSCRAG